MEELIITSNPGTCISADIPIMLGNFTVFAGENNSGKTTLVNRIIADPILKDFVPIIIPADEINPNNSTLKTANKTSPFYQSIQLILKPIFEKDILNGLVKKFDKSKDKKKFIKEVNMLLSNYGVDNKQFDIRIPTDKFESSLIIKIAEGIIHDQYDTEIDIVDINNIGMGTQRLLACALLQYYENQKSTGSKSTLIVVEEPEIYLHPKYKERFFKTLKLLSEKKNTYVIITTHDPYFIELSANQTIYKVYRDKGKNDSTFAVKVEEDRLLPYPSASEINYLVFGMVTSTIFLELYEYLKYLKKYNDFDSFDTYLAGELDIEKEFDKDPPHSGKVTIITRIRHDLAHPKRNNLVRFNEFGEDSIKGLIGLINPLYFVDKKGLPTSGNFDTISKSLNRDGDE